MVQYSATCRCGNISIKATGEPDRVGLCHCSDCRKYHGALFHASAIFPEHAVTVTGETRTYGGRSFCPKCGSPLFAVSGKEVEISLGSMDDASHLIPSYELWTTNRESWLPPLASAQQFERDRPANSCRKHSEQ